jgi:hypothetical protein
MQTKKGIALLVTVAVTLVAAADAGAATRAQYGAKCNAAWTGKHGTKAYRTFKRHCIAAAISASAAARTAGNNDNAAANRARAGTACRAEFPPPRRSKAKRTAFKACVAAAISAQKAYGGRPLSATLAGDPATDTDGAGTATFTLNQGHGQICFNVAWTNLGAVSSLHIHSAATDAIVVALDTDANLTDGNAKGCVNGVANNLVKAIRQHPEQYYVNVHTDEFAAGAIRGTLHK